MLKGLFSSSSDGPPNFVIIMADDLGYGDLGCYGARDIATPRLDELASEGMRFTSYYSGAPNCTGSRAALLTGCYPNRIGLSSKNLPPGGYTGLNPEEKNIATILNEASYATGFVGKWSLGSHPNFLPLSQGFDYYFGIPFSHSFVDSATEDHIYLTSGLPLIDNEVELEEDTDPTALTQRFTEQAAEFIESAGENPFCLIMSHHLPHRPIAVPPEFEGRSTYGPYGDAVEAIDWSSGAIIDVLKSLNHENDTMVIFVSDNGPYTAGQTALGHRCGNSGEFRGGKNHTTEGGMRVPCIVRWPKHVPAGKVCDEIVCAMDFLPTFAGLAKVQLPRTHKIDGKNILPLLKGEKPKEPIRTEFYYYRESRLQAVRSGEWKMHVFHPEWGIDEPKPEDYKLFNLDADPGEGTDVSPENPEVVELLGKAADRARRELGDSVKRRSGMGVRPIGEVKAG